MARLIPTFIDETSPSGEREVFNFLRQAPNDWVALHSLDLSPWNKGRRTEIDFLLIMPAVGILCIEVKSDEHIGLDQDGCWHPPNIKRSPFKQALDARGTFYRKIKKLLPKASRVPVVHVCIFTNSYFELQPNLAVQPWEIIDRARFRACLNPSDFSACLASCARQSIEADERIHPISTPLNNDLVESIVSFCLPVRRRLPDAADEVLKRAEETDRSLRQQQRPVLNLVKWNKRVVISGGAGTGKTQIALEVARRLAESGSRVGLLCFNALIGRRISNEVQQFTPPVPTLIAGSAYQVLAAMTDTVIPENASHSFWETEFPERIQERLTDPDFRPAVTFDYLVLDEAQDVLARPLLWDCLCQFVPGGLQEGSYGLFGDFDFQVLSGRDEMKHSLKHLSNLGKPAYWKLDENCRNYPVVGEAAIALSGLKSAAPPVYSGYIRAGRGSEVFDIFFYESDNDQLQQVARWLKELKNRGLSDNDITLLSFKKDMDSAAERLKQRGVKLRPIRASGNGVTFSTVHAFKGLENKAIILTDVSLTDAGFKRDLFYTGITRATEEIRIACDASSKSQLLKWMT